MRRFYLVFMVAGIVTGLHYGGGYRDRTPLATFARILRIKTDE